MIRQRLLLTLLFGSLTSMLLGLTSFEMNREEYGKVGYYSDALQGRKTASGEKYDKNLLTCAHKTLPFGTLVRITRLDNKLSVVVRVNDRGPYRDGYVIEVSRRGAEELDLIKVGSTKVKVEVIEKPTEEETITSSASLAPKSSRPAAGAADARPVQYNTPTSTKPAAGTAKTAATTAPTTSSKTVAPSSANATTLTPAKSAATNASDLYQVGVEKAPKQGFGVQVTTLYNAPNVYPEIVKLQKLWPGKVLVSMQPMPEATENTVYKLVVGPFPDRAAADKARREAIKKGYAKCFVVDLSQI